MKNTTAARIIAIVCVILLSVAILLPAQAERAAAAERAENGHGEFYPKLAIVVGLTILDEDCTIITCEDMQGELWSFYDDEQEWMEGDIVNLLMWDIGETEEKDEIVEIYWEGYTDNIESFFQVVNWR